MAAKVSKNARAGQRQEQVKNYCARGHETTRVLVAGQGMRFMCECNGYEPIKTNVPYASIQPKLKTGGNSRIWFESRQA